MPVPIRIVVWNCNMALHSKCERLLSLRPDIAVVPECAQPEIVRQKAPTFEFTDCEWRGTSKNKGLGVFGFGDVRLRLHESWDRRFHLFLPIEICGRETFNLLAVWAFNSRAPHQVAPNPGTTAEAVAYYADFLAAAPAVVAGDFNASVFWDASGRYESFTALDAALSALGLVSAYHAASGHTLGAEPAPTHFWQKKVTQPFHIDYVYIPRGWKPRLREASVGSAAEWLPHSDHAPLVVELA